MAALGALDHGRKGQGRNSLSGGRSFQKTEERVPKTHPRGLEQPPVQPAPFPAASAACPPGEGIPGKKPGCIHLRPVLFHSGCGSVSLSSRDRLQGDPVVLQRAMSVPCQSHVRGGHLPVCSDLGQRTVSPLGPTLPTCLPVGFAAAVRNEVFPPGSTAPSGQPANTPGCGPGVWLPPAQPHPVPGALTRFSGEG